MLSAASQLEKSRAYFFCLASAAAWAMPVLVSAALTAGVAALEVAAASAMSRQAMIEDMVSAERCMI